MATIALMLAACSETIGGFNPTTHVAEVDADAGSQASNAGNIASLTEVIERNPHDATAYNTRGVVYAKLGRYSNAIEDFTHAIELDPNFSGAYTNRALAYRQTKKDNLALQDFNQAIIVNPNDAAAYLGRGNLLRSENDFAARARRPQPGDQAQPGRRAGISRARADLSAPGRQRPGDHRFQQCDRSRPVRGRAIPGPWPEFDGHRQV